MSKTTIFKKIYIEITNYCNLNCTFCPRTSRAKCFMSKNDFEYILKSIKGYTKHIYLHVMGEPLLHTELKELLDIAHNQNFFVNITTNGTLIEKNSDIILNSKAVRKLSFSLHSYLDNDIDVDKNLDDVFSFADKASERILIEYRLWNKLAKDIDNSSILKKLSAHYSIEESNFSDTCKLQNNVYLSMAEQFVWSEDNVTAEFETGFCYALRDQIAILVDGTVIPCCLDNQGKMALGNIKNQNLESILQSSRAQNLYNNFSNRKITEEICSHCNFIQLRKL